MDRRTLLTTGAGIAGSLTLAGCFQLESRSTRGPQVLENRPDGVYIPSHVEGMEMSGMTTEGEYAFGLMYSYAHRFWNVTGTEVSRTDIQSDDDVHLMASVWDPETGTVLPETGLTVEIYQSGSLVTQEAIYPMLSQPMGFHYGANFGLDGDGEYDVRLNVGALPTRRTGAFEGRFTEPTTAEIPFAYSQRAKEEISFELLDEKAGSPGAVGPMSMEMMPDSRAPSASELPGTIVGSAMSNDARFVVSALESPPAGIVTSGQYIAVSARTRYNKMLLPAMGLTGTLKRDGETVFEGEFTRTLDPDLQYHYGAVVDGVESGDELTLSVTTQPQTARHEGYETAFGGLQGGMPDTSLTVE